MESTISENPATPVQRLHLRSSIVPVVVPLLFMVLSAFAINKYQFGIGDHCINIPYLKKFIDPNLYPNDYLVEQREFFYTFLWIGLAAIVKSSNISISSVFFTCYLVSLYFTFLGFYKLSIELFDSQVAAVVALFLFLFPDISLGGGGTLGTYLGERVVAKPVLFFSLVYFLRESYFRSYILLGIAFLIHPLSAVYIIIALSTCCLSSFRTIGIPTILKSFGILLFVASPILIWKLLHAPSSLHLLYADPEWLDLLRLRSAHHLFPSAWEKDNFFRAFLTIAVLLASFKYRPSARHHRCIQILLCCIGFLCVAGTIFTEIFPTAIVIQLQLFRSFKWITYIAIIYFANYFVRELTKQQSYVEKLAAVLLAVAVLYNVYEWKYAFCTLFLFALSIVCYEAISRYRIRKEHLIAGISFFALGLSFYYHFEILPVGPVNKNWTEIQRWAKRNTELFDKFIVPPDQEGFRIASERTIYGDWKDGTQMFFNPDFGREWMKRMRRLGYDRRHGLRKGFDGLNEDEFLAIASELRRDDEKIYLVSFTDNSELSFHISHRNNDFVVYEIPNQQTSLRSN